VSMEDGVKAIRSALNAEKVKLTSFPKFFLTLSQVEEIDYVVHMSDGSSKLLLGRDIARLKSIVPHYLHEKVKIPIVIYITMNPRCRFAISGDVWQARTLGVVLRNRLLWEPETCLREEEFVKAVRELGSLLHVCFKEDVWVSASEVVEGQDS